MIAANPASRPLQISSTLFQCPTNKHLLNKVVRALVQSANVVLTAVLPMTFHCNKTTITVWSRYREKWTRLNSYQPNHKKNEPSMTRDALWPRKVMDLPSWSNWPTRGPSINAPHKPTMPPTMWNTLEPAKSMTPELNKRSSIWVGLAQLSLGWNQCETIG